MTDRGIDLDDRVGERDARRRGRLSPTDRVGTRAHFAPTPRGGLPVLDSTDRLIFASANYLGLTADQRVQNAARQAAAVVGTGAGAGRLDCGDTLVHHDLERLLAEVTGNDRALTFSSGYATNVGVVAALAPDVVFVDDGCHESVLDGCRLADATVVRYGHHDAEALAEALVERATESTDGESWLVVTESVSRFDGGVTPLPAICDLADEHGAWLMVDDTHGIGLYANGGGVVQAEGLTDCVDVQTASLSAALASQGGFVAGDDELIEYLATAARQFTHSAGLAPPAAAAASEALHVARHDDCRERLWRNVEHLRDGFSALGFAVDGESQLFAPVTGTWDDVVERRDVLYESGVVVAASPSPTAAEEALLRVAPMAPHAADDVVTCLEAFRDVTAELGDP